MTVASHPTTVHLWEQSGSVLSADCSEVVENSNKSLPLDFSLNFMLGGRSIYQNGTIHFKKELSRNKMEEKKKM